MRVFCACIIDTVQAIARPGKQRGSEKTDEIVDSVVVIQPHKPSFHLSRIQRRWGSFCREINQGFKKFGHFFGNRQL
jgi:hypothetical protein